MTFLLFCLEDADNFWCCSDDIWNYVNWKSIPVTENQYKLHIGRSMKSCTPYLCQRKNASQSVFIIQYMYSSQAVCFPSQGIFNTAIGKPLYNSSEFCCQEPPWKVCVNVLSFTPMFLHLPFQLHFFIIIFKLTFYVCVFSCAWEICDFSHSTDWGECECMRQVFKLMTVCFQVVPPGKLFIHRL